MASMKRKSGDYGSAQTKRPKHGDHNGHGENKEHDISRRQNFETGRQQGPRYSTGTGATSTTQGSAPPHKQARTVTPSDPLLALEASLRLLVDRPEASTSHLGSHALQNAKELLKDLSKRTKTSTASLDLFQPSTVNYQTLPPLYSKEPLREYPLPDLPQVPEGPYSTTPFVHASAAQTDRVTTANDLNYERLEFLGDAYIEIISTRLIFSRYPHLPSGRQAQMREQLVKNETLMGFSRAYNFDKRLKAAPQEMSLSTKQGNKGLGKIIADVFEAYVAAVVLSDPETGFQRVEQWLTELWAPMILKLFGPEAINSLEGNYDPLAKAALQKRIGKNGVKIEYLQERPMEQSKHVQRYFVGVYLTGWGHEKRFLGQGDGQNKVEAGNRAAMEAMVANKDLVEECEKQLAEERRLKAEEKERQEAKANSGENVKGSG